METKRIFIKEEMIAYWIDHPEAKFYNVGMPTVRLAWDDGEIISVSPVITGKEHDQPLENAWILVDEQESLPQLTRDIIWSESDFEIQHPLLSLEYGWKYENKIMTPNQFATLVMAVGYPTDQLSDILTNALWYEIADN